MHCFPNWIPEKCEFWKGILKKGLDVFLFDQESFPISLPGPFLIQSSGRTSRKLQNSFTHCFPVSLPWLDFPSSFWPLAFSVGTSVLTSLFAVVCLPHCPALPIFRLSLWGQGRSNFSLYSYSPEESPGKEKKKKRNKHMLNEWVTLDKLRLN